MLNGYLQCVIFGIGQNHLDLKIVSSLRIATILTIMRTKLGEKRYEEKIHASAIG